MKLKLAVLLLISAFLPAPQLEAVVTTSDDFGTVRRVVDALSKKVAAKEILVVFDIDNTLLQMDTDLGSDQWFDWQTELLSTDDKLKAASDFVSLLKVQGMLFAAANMSPPGGKAEVDVAMEVKARFPAIVLTSRSCHYDPGKSYSFLDATHRELKRNGYEFESSALEPKAGFGGSFVSYTDKEIEKMHLTDEQKKSMSVAAGPRRSCYSRGIYMTAGQHKGLMLRALLQKTGTDKRFKSIVAVDDKEKYCKQYEEAFQGKAPVHCVRYSKTDARVAAFRASDKTELAEGLKQLKEAAGKVLSIDWK